ncbi:hypothetical protein [Panacagrimonas sp.]|uniref:hypothetical protein n=1 Tax=Panacagrimonas sp. TaxID=2480088 RepID=UPI003B5238FA
MPHTNILDEAYFALKSKLGFCTANVKDAAALLERAKTITENASQVASFVKVATDVKSKLQTAASAIEKVHASVSTAAGAATDLQALCQLSDALGVLNTWVKKPEHNQDKAAQAFDALFGAVANFAAKLPPPANTYAKVLEQVSIAKFFSNMQGLGASRTGDNVSTPTGRQMRDVMREIEGQ